MRTEDQAQARHLSEGMQLIFNQESSLTPRRSSSRSSDSSCSYSSSDRSRSPSVSRRRRSHGSRYSSSSSSSSSRSRSRSHPRCCRASERSRCRRRRRSRSYSPYSRRSSPYGRRRYSRSSSRSSSRERYYRRSRRSRSRSSSYRRTRGAYAGRFRCRFSPSPSGRYYRRRSKSPERSVWLSQKDKMDLLNIAKHNAAKILGVEVVTLPASIEEQVKKMPGSDTEKTVRADPLPLKKPPQDKGEACDDVGVSTSKTSPGRKPIIFSISNAVAKPSSSPNLHVTESNVTSRADSVDNRKPYGQWIPVKTVSTKKR